MWHTEGKFLKVATFSLEMSCYKKRQKSPSQETDNKTSEDYEWYQFDSNWLTGSLMLIYDQFGIIQNLQTSPIAQTKFLVATFFAVSYSKTALVF